MKNLRLAWRNLWRNKRRTLITVASIFFGVLISTVMNSMQDGTYSNMIDMMVKLSTGYIQVQNPEFKENKSINNAFSPSKEQLQKIIEIKEVKTVTQRLESFALLSSGPNTRGGAVIGVEPDNDKQTSNLQNWISQGEFLEKGDNGVLVTFNVAKHLNLGVNDTIVLISQGYHGVTAAGKYPIKGILTFNTPQMNNIGVFMDLPNAQQLFSAEGMITSILIMVDDYTNVLSAQHKISEIANGSLAVLNWKELNPELVQYIESDKYSAYLMLGILYIVIGFGIFGTIIMMVAERKRELGVMIAVGMQKFKLAAVLFYETILIGLVGVLSGFVVSVPIILILVHNPITLPAEMAEIYAQYGFDPYLFFGTAPNVFINQVLTVFIITVVVSLYPIFKVKNMIVSKALRA
jgi:putative ABC transport system permease protein